MTISYGCGDDKPGMTQRTGCTCGGMLILVRDLARLCGSVL